VLTLGLDLSTANAKTAACVLDWNTGPDCRAAHLSLGHGDDALLALMAQADAVGIDAPFGWPDAFRGTIDGWSERDEWPLGMPRSELRFRLTDDALRSKGRTPLSVSADRIAATAMRCAELLARHCAAQGEGLDRVSGHAVEVYPAATLVAWEFDVRGYKDAAATEQRRRIAERLDQEARLGLPDEAIGACSATDHVLDALVASLTVRAHALGLTHPPPSLQAAQVAREGWIQLPVPDSLPRLSGP